MASRSRRLGLFFSVFWRALGLWRGARAFGAGLRGQHRIAGKASLGRGDVATAFFSGIGRERWVLREAPLFAGHALSPFPGDFALLFRVHGGKAAFGFNGFLIHQGARNLPGVAGRKPRLRERRER